jgi:DNA-binding transcriptional LysR family regulator
MEPAHVLGQAIEQVATQVEHFQPIGEPEDLTRKLRQPSVQPQLSRTGQITPPQRLEICAHDRVLESWVGDHLFRNAAMRWRVSPSSRPALMLCTASAMASRGLMAAAAFLNRIRRRTYVLLEERLVVLLPRAHFQAGNRRVALASLSGERFVTVRASASSNFRQRFVLSCREAGFDPHITQETGEWATVAGLVSSGMGVALAPASVAEIRLAGLVQRPLSQPASTTVVLFCRPDEAETPAAHFIAAARGHSSATTA